MSHVVEIKTEVRDVAAARAACQRLHLETPAEGRQIEVPYRGTVVDVLSRIRGHLRSAVSYAGEGSLSKARAKIVKDPLSYLVPLSEAAQRESYER